VAKPNGVIDADKTSHLDWLVPGNFSPEKRRAQQDVLGIACSLFEMMTGEYKAQTSPLVTSPKYFILTL
jgi:hypothetical protein